MSVTRAAVPSLFLCVLLSGPSAWAKNGASAPSDQAPEIQITSAVQLRNEGTTLGTDQDRSLTARPASANRRQAIGDTSFVTTRRSHRQAAKAARTQNPYQQALDKLRTRAGQIDPSAQGRVEISFVIGKHGEPTKAAVYGISAEMDHALTAELQGLRFPAKQAGQFYTSKLSIVATAKKAPVKKARKRRAHRVARRK